VTRRSATSFLLRRTAPRPALGVPRKNASLYFQSLAHSSQFTNPRISSIIFVLRTLCQKHPGVGVLRLRGTSPFHTPSSVGSSIRLPRCLPPVVTPAVGSIASPSGSHVSQKPVFLNFDNAHTFVRKRYRIPFVFLKLRTLGNLPGWVPQNFPVSSGLFRGAANQHLRLN
jgi:hypothetical protein